MKKYLILITLIFCTKYGIAQQLDFILLDKLANISIAESDSYMINYYGFEKVQNKSISSKRTYAKYSDNNLDNTIIITILFSENGKNNLEVSLAKNFKINNIKNKLVEKGYRKQSVIDFEFDRYKKGKSTFFLSQIPNEIGQINIKITSES